MRWPAPTPRTRSRCRALPCGRPSATYDVSVKPCQTPAQQIGKPDGHCEPPTGPRKAALEAQTSRFVSRDWVATALPADGGRVAIYDPAKSENTYDIDI